MIAVSPAANGYVHGQAYKALYATILGPFFLTILLLFVSGLTLQERRILSILEQNKHLDPIPTANIREAAHDFEENDILGISDLCLRSS
jgi:hypothetical protein